MVYALLTCPGPSLKNTQITRRLALARSTLPKFKKRERERESKPKETAADAFLKGIRGRSLVCTWLFTPPGGRGAEAGDEGMLSAHEALWPRFPAQVSHR